jgi:hypothetical protein
LHLPVPAAHMPPVCPHYTVATAAAAAAAGAAARPLLHRLLLLRW